MSIEMERLDKHRSELRTPSGPVSYIDTGGPGRPVLLVHGVGSSSYLWRNVIELLDGERRCVSFDLPLHGYTPAAPGQDFTLNGLARFIAGCCDTLDLTDIDLVANDTGGAISQVFAAGHAGRLHTLTLTNCEAHGNVPPKVLLPAVLLARLGLMAPIAQRLTRNIPRAKKTVYGMGYQDISKLPDDIARVWLEAQGKTRQAARQAQRLLVSLHARDLLAAEPAPARAPGPDPHRLGHQRPGLPHQVGLLAARHHPRRHRSGRDRPRAPVLPRRAGRRADRCPAPPLGRSSLSFIGGAGVVPRELAELS